MKALISLLQRFGNWRVPLVIGAVLGFVWCVGFWLWFRNAPDKAYDVRLGRDASITFFTRVRSSAALVVLLTAVGTAVALAIGLVLYLAGLALRHTLR